MSFTAYTIAVYVGVVARVNGQTSNPPGKDVQCVPKLSNSAAKMAHAMARNAAVQREGVKTVGNYIGSSQTALKRSFVKYNVARATKKRTPCRCEKQALNKQAHTLSSTTWILLLLYDRVYQRVGPSVGLSNPF